MQVCVWSFSSIEALVFEKRGKTHRLNIVDAADNANTMKTTERDPYVNSAKNS